MKKEGNLENPKEDMIDIERMRNGYCFCSLWRIRTLSLYLELFGFKRRIIWKKITFIGRKGDGECIVK